MLEQVQRLLVVLAALAQKGSGTDAHLVGGYLTLLAELLESGADYRDELRALTAEVQAMVDEGREPSVEDFEALQRRSQAARERIAQAKAALVPTPAVDEPGDAPGEPEGPSDSGS